MVGAHVIDVVGTALGAEVNPMLLVFLLGSGYTMTVVEQEPAETEPCTGDAGQLSSDVATQTSIDNGETSGVFLPNDSRMDANLAQRIHDSGDYTGYCNGTHGGALKFTASVYQHNFHQDYKGDAYGDHGYIGDGRVFFEQARGISKVFHWTFTEVGHP